MLSPKPMKPIRKEASLRYLMLEKWDAFLATRERGRRVREDIEQSLASLRPGETLALDFSGVEAITVSFGDECVAKLLADRTAGDFPDKGLVVEGANDDVRETLDVVLQRRKLAIVATGPEGFEVLGPRDWLDSTLNVAARLRSFSARELAEELDLTPQASNNRLKHLMATGAVIRELVIPEGGGKEYLYRFVVPELV